VALVCAGWGLLVVSAGDPHVARGAAGGSPAVALSEGSRARFTSASGGAAETLSGPDHVLLDASRRALGPPAARLFHELEFFGGPLAGPARERPSDLHLWRVTGGLGARLTDALELRPVEGLAAVAWAPSSRMRGATALRVHLRGPEGLVVGLGPFGAEGVLTPAPAQLEPGLGSVDLPLPDGWFQSLGWDEMVISFRWPASSTGPEPVVRFDGATFLWERGAGSP
jgi:hypothetical protein